MTIMQLEKYRQNLKIVGDKVFSYQTNVAIIDHSTRTLKILGKWSMTTTKHVNYIAQQLNLKKEYVYQKLWQKLGEIAVNEEDEIEDSFLHFEKGTDKEEIWHWFEEKFNISVAKDLMNI